MHSHFAHRRLVAASRGGFTLVEMMVATTLVVLMMLMFAQIYIAAVSSLGDQQAIARNDAKSRLADMLLRGDLRRGSYRAETGSQNGIYPLVRYETPSIYQRGYFYLSENSEANPLDDVLQFTTFVSRYSRNRDPSPYYGRAALVTLGGAPVLGYHPNPVVTSPQRFFSNHPDIDDSLPDGVGSSRAAEVAYFVRNGNLYRRSLLIRDLDQAGNVAYNSAQPSLGAAGTEFFGRITPAAATDPNFYKSFDYAAYVRADETAPNNPNLDSVQFLGLDSLENDDNSVESLGRSRLRFGTYHNPSSQYFAFDASTLMTPPDPEQLIAFNSIVSSRGQPVEFSAAGLFFGRPKHVETEFWKWGWPGNRRNPLGPALPDYNEQTDQLSADFGSGVEPIRNPANPAIASRETEDLLLTNVEAFDVEVWDPGLFEFDSNGDGNFDLDEDLNKNGYVDRASGWVQLGNTTNATGYFRSAQRLNEFYGPGEADSDQDGTVDSTEDRNGNGQFDRSAVFDTGHPDMWTDDPSQPNYAAAAQTQDLRPPYRPLFYRFDEDTNNNGSLQPGEDLNGNGRLDRPVFPTRRALSWTPGTAYTDGDVVFRQSTTEDTQSFYYQCISPGTSAATEPTWMPGTTTDGSVVWRAFDNRIGLQKIRITIRYRDPIENLPRQISIIHSFVNPQE